VRVNSSVVQIKVEDAALRKALGALAPRVNEAVRKKGARAAMSPFLKQLRSLWRAASFRGKPTHRRAISSATRIDIRRRGSGSLAPLRIQMGVQYGKKGGASARGRQRVWHLLENGFRHRSGAAVLGKHISGKFAVTNVQKMMDAVTTETMAAAKAALKG